MLTIFSVACNSGSEDPDYSNFNHIVKKGSFEIYLPKYLKPDKKINPKATLAYADSANNTIFMVIRDQIPNTEKDNITIQLENYFNFAQLAIFNTLEDPKESKRENIFINLNEAITAKIEGKYGDQKIYYCLTVVETENYFYQLIGWTLFKLKDTNGAEIYDAALSFAELD